jgi:hypothetical protein
VKIENSHKVPPSILVKADSIWQMEAEELYQFCDDMWTFVPETIDTLDDFYGPELMVEIKKRQDAIIKEKERKRNATVEVDGTVYKTINYFDMYHLGWESDTKAWVVEKDGAAALVHSSHGGTYFDEDATAFLQSKIKELNSNIKAMKTAVTLLEINV